MTDTQESSLSFQRDTYTDESNSDNNSSDIVSLINMLTSNKKRTKNKLSFVWKYFEVIGTKDVCQVVVKKKEKD
jgi:hypothetical protein